MVSKLLEGKGLDIFCYQLDQLGVDTYMDGGCSTAICKGHPSSWLMSIVLEFHATWHVAAVRAQA
uniref:Uncharacterized protein n=1 Tax=Musa balbisiana TaxID=52838 RepID=L8BSP2_MUSBA|nr:Hypothetical protein BN340_102 [Musa balbisiana]